MMLAEVETRPRITGRGMHRPPGGAPAAERSLLPVSAVAVSAALGVLVAAAAYTAGRLGHASSPWADRGYWLGQILIIAPAAARLLSRRYLAGAETAALVVILTVAEYLVKVAYSPGGFTFPDELEHWRGTVNILQSGKLFTPNYLLPISTHYPGLESAAAALASITGLSAFTSGLIVAGAAHLLFVCLLFVLFRELSRSHRIAGLAAVLYAANSHFQSFDSMFAYQTLALAFLGLTLLATRRLIPVQPAGARAGWFAVAVIGAAATTVTHHVTSYVMAVSLLLISLTSLLTRGWRSAAWPALLTVLAAAAVAGWLTLAAPDTISYLRPAAEEILNGFRGILTGQRPAAPAVSIGPVPNQVLSAATTVIISALLPLGWRRVWRRYRRDLWAVAMVIGSAAWYPVILIRLVVADGPELAGRASTFVFIPVAYIAALAVFHWAGAVAATAVRWKRRAIAAAALAGALTLTFDGLANGWPPYWERLPGPHQVAGFERSVDPAGIAAAQWSLGALGPGNRFAADFGNYAVLGSYGDQNPVRDVSYLYTSPAFTVADALQVQRQSVQYVLVDLRLSQALPASGQYFPVDPNAGKYRTPLAAAGLTKFAGLPGASRLYDSGDIAIYSIGGADAP